MNLIKLTTAAFCLSLSVPSSAQPAVVEAQRVDNLASVLPVNTMLMVTPEQEVTSKKMKEGDKHRFLVVEDIVYNGAIVIPRGSPVLAVVTWRTGKGIVGKSAKYDLSFELVRVGNKSWKIRGQHRQEGRGNTAGALLGSMLITGKSAVMLPGQIVNAFTAEPIPFK